MISHEIAVSIFWFCVAMLLFAGATEILLKPRIEKAYREGRIVYILFYGFYDRPECPRIAHELFSVPYKRLKG